MLHRPGHHYLVGASPSLSKGQYLEVTVKPKLMNDVRVYIGLRVDKAHPAYIANHLVHAAWSILSVSRRIEQVGADQLT